MKVSNSIFKALKRLKRQGFTLDTLKVPMLAKAANVTKRDIYHQLEAITLTWNKIN